MGRCPGNFNPKYKCLEPKANVLKKGSTLDIQPTTDVTFNILMHYNDKGIKVISSNYVPKEYAECIHIFFT